MKRLVWLAAVAVPLAFGSAVHSAELRSPTIEAFDRYTRIAESNIEAEVTAPDRFLHVFHGDAAERTKTDRALRRGEIAIERLKATDHGRRIDVPEGLIHHWIGSIYVPDVTLRSAVAVLQDFDQHAELFRPNIARSKILEHDGDRFRLALRFNMKKIISVTVDTESRRDHEVPVRYLDGNEWHDIVEAAGPDRVSGGQWSSAYAREYFRCVREDGMMVWLFRGSQQQTKDWFLHGWWD